MTVLPPAPGPEYVFTPPPSWGTPEGFDPRRGHVVDPSWPSAPDGWQFWTLPIVPPATRFGNGLNRIGKGRILFGAIALVFVVIRLGGLFGGGPATGVGSCWEGANGSKSKPVDCSDSSAKFRVIAQTPDPYQCPAASDSYLDSKEDGASRYKCLVPIP
jgi:hypothetical protein